MTYRRIVRPVYKLCAAGLDVSLAQSVLPSPFELQRARKEQGRAVGAREDHRI
jgi:hypothetical protein